MNARVAERQDGMWARLISAATLSFLVREGFEKTWLACLWWDIPACSTDRLQDEQNFPTMQHTMRYST